MSTNQSGTSTPTALSSSMTMSETAMSLLKSNSRDASAPWVVQKFGGTSVGKSLDNIVSIADSYLAQHKVAIASKEALRPSNSVSNVGGSGLASGSQTPIYPKRVGSGFFGASATGAGTEKDKMSSSLSSLKDLKMTANGYSRSASPSPFQSSAPVPPSPTMGQTESGRESPESYLPAFHSTVDVLKRDHIAAARQQIRDEDLLEELIHELERDCESLRSFLSAAQIIDEISLRSQDSIVGMGERMACKIVAAALRDRGIDSELVLLDTIVDDALGGAIEEAASADISGDQGAAQLDQTFYDRLSERLGERLRCCGSRVPVITGYFGAVPGSLLAQIGRGYTDLCAALCAVGLGAAELQVWKEVDGIFTADPRKVPTARLVPIITPDEAAELTYYGSEVIHPFTMEQVIRAKIPIRIKNVDNPAGEGTIIYPQESSEVNGHTASEASTSGIPSGGLQAVKLPTAVTIKDNIVVLNIHSNRKTISHGFLARIFGTLDRAGVVVDLISTSEVHVSMAMQDFSNRKSLDRVVRDLEKIGHITVSHDMAILSLVGRQMRHMVGTAGKMFATLAEGNINIEMISQGASEINISCVIDNRDSIKALNLIHQSCLTAPSASMLAAAGMR
ncbi:hypothetical protein QFC22_000427 [Naganishia vaughanmartiniae]|uniref:Uncharacterized protein n=1 Tax=Naganishia vaughanmartiniae TaxID=1424756 RepID=A0ACC2XP96_9TREE|nr:hypothetical protein QFC22_000427 [Naganishia vaughanmartiniae]